MFVRPTRSFALCAVLALPLAACIDNDEPLEEADALTLETVQPLTSVCVTRADGKTVRFDRAAILPQVDPFESFLYNVAPTGTTHIGTGLSTFMERGGAGLIQGPGQKAFVAAGGRAFSSLTGGGGTIWVKSGGTVQCANRPLKIYYEPGAILQGCAGATLVQQATTATFRRCTPTTAVNMIAPLPALALGRAGQTLTSTNKSTGSYTTPRWKLEVRQWSTGTTKVLFTSTSATGFQFQLPANFATLYPASSWDRSVMLTIRDPFGVDLQRSDSF